MKKNKTQIFRNIESEIKNYEDSIINSLLTEDEKKATKLYTYKFDRKEEKYVPEEWVITKIEVIFGHIKDRPIRPKINKRASEKDIILLRNYFSWIKNNNKDIFFYIERCYSSGKILSGVGLSSIKEVGDYAFTVEALEPIMEKKTKRWIELYKPREGYTACAYCGKQVPIEKVVKHKIIGRGWDERRHKQVVTEQIMEFCSGECAFNEQCAREG